MIAWSYEMNGSQLLVAGSPLNKLLINVSGMFEGTADAVEHHGTYVEAEIPSLGVRWNRWFEPIPPRLVHVGGIPAQFQIGVPWDSRLVRQIEEKRARAHGDFELKLTLTTHYRECYRQEIAREGGHAVAYIPGEVGQHNPALLRVPIVAAQPHRWRCAQPDRWASSGVRTVRQEGDAHRVARAESAKRTMATAEPGGRPPGRRWPS